MPALIPRPTFRMDLKVETVRRDGSKEVFWMHFPGVFSGRTPECALAAATEAACEEVLRISKRPQYDLMTHLGAEWHLLNIRFKRVDVEDDDEIRESGSGR
jgi:hypothetical protein